MQRRRDALTCVASKIENAIDFSGSIVDRVTDHDDFGSSRSKITNVIDSNSLEHAVENRFGHHALINGDGDGKGSENKEDGFG